MRKRIKFILHFSKVKVRGNKKRTEFLGGTLQFLVLEKNSLICSYFFQIAFFISRKGFSANTTGCSLIFLEKVSAEWEGIFRMHIKDKGSKES